MTLEITEALLIQLNASKANVSRLSHQCDSHRHAALLP